ncbi:hypothetical protein Q8A67_000825 [Cirrhinus molitorella]|uniref:Uncharacterized protein n=1 Tax=Cirrhinus molitorella TaxID=172907 RepID=A0AA88U732_9TELE|nr:hypothetical protein Q8A67_000825 [Cirrhinus molitorella]
MPEIHSAALPESLSIPSDPVFLQLSGLFGSVCSMALSHNRLLVHVVGSSPSEDRDIWTVDSFQEKPNETDILVHIADLVKRSKSQQFHGLMGRSTGFTQPVRLGQRRNKGGEIFVGLMGRRSSSRDFQEEWDRPQLY